MTKDLEQQLVDAVADNRRLRAGLVQTATFIRDGRFPPKWKHSIIVKIKNLLESVRPAGQDRVILAIQINEAEDYDTVLKRIALVVGEFIGQRDAAKPTRSDPLPEATPGDDGGDRPCGALLCGSCATIRETFTTQSHTGPGGWQRCCSGCSRILARGDSRREVEGFAGAM